MGGVGGLISKKRCSCMYVRACRKAIEMGTVTGTGTEWGQGGLLSSSLMWMWAGGGGRGRDWPAGAVYLSMIVIVLRYLCA